MGIIKIKSLRQAENISGKRVFLRADFNVPLKVGKTGNIKIADEFKIIAALPTIRYLARYRCKIIIGTHLGRPEGSKKLEVESKKLNKLNSQYSVRSVAARLSKILGKKIKFVDDCVGFQAGTKASKMKNGEILVLENLRFYQEEKNNDLMFAKRLANLAEIYINDAFAVCHRAHASVSAVKNYLPSYAGLLLEKELLNLNKILKSKESLVLAIGGAKIKTKIPLLKKIGRKADKILIGGALANSFLAARKIEIGASLADRKSIALAKQIGKFNNIILPADALTQKAGKNKILVKNIYKINKDEKILDIGPETIKLFSHFIKKAGVIVWNGPMGVFEDKNFKHGTLAIARLIAARSRGRAFGVAAGGETVAALKMSGMMDDMDWVSTGGGAMLAYLGGENMPGLQGIS